MYELKVFGRASLEGPDGPVTGSVTQRLRLAVLAVLAASPGGATSRDTILALLWPDIDADRARHALSNALYAIRRGLGDEAITVAGPELRINRSHVRADAVEFERMIASGDLEGATSAYASPFLDGFHLAGNCEFERWVDCVRSRFAASQVEALRRLAGETDDPAARARWLTRAVAIEPLSSNATLELMRALVDARDIPAALRQARVHEALMDDSLGAAPHPDVANMAAELRHSLAAEVATGTTPPNFDTHINGGPEAAKVEADERPGYSRWRRWMRAPTTAVAMSLLLVLSVGGHDMDSPPAPTRLAVLPLADLTGDASQDYFAAAMTDLLATELGRISALVVRSPRSGRSIRRDSPVTLAAIGRELDVDVVLEGEVVRQRDRTRITLRLVQVSPERQLWSESYERTGTNALALQQDVARAVAAAARVTLSPTETMRLAVTPVIAAEAEELYLRAVYRLGRFTAPDLREAISALEGALVIEPAFAAAWSALGSAYWLLSQPAAGLPSSVGMPLARQAALRAIELDPNSSGGHATLGWVRLFYDWDWNGALESFRRAAQLAPNQAGPLIGWGFTLSALGHHDAAKVALERAVELDPLWLPARTALAEVSYNAGHFDEAERALHDVMEFDPDYVRAHDILRWIHELRGDYIHAAESRMDRIRLVGGESHSRLAAHNVPTTGIAYWQDFVARLDDRSSDNTAPNYLYARALARTGNADSAFSRLNAAVDAREGQMALLLVDPQLDVLRGDPRYRELLDRVGLPSDAIVGASEFDRAASPILAARDE